VLIIGESFGPHHSQQYGYAMPTTPRQIKRENSGLLTKFTDVVAPWNLTSFVFKYMLSTHVIGQEGEWCDYPLFPQLFRKAGYKVTFLTNQFLPKAKQEVYDFSGGFFINDPELSHSMFDVRNTTTYPYDDGLLAAYDSLASLPSGSAANLYIFHLIGQHMDYYLRCPKDRYKFKPENYDKLRPDLKLPRKKRLAFYDNAVLYNDSIVDEICRRFEHQNAIVMYMPDHGEECYEPGRNIICRNHSARVTYDLARYEFAIPFWIWCSPEYAHKNPEIYHEIVAAKHRRFMTDALPHMLLYLAGISCPYYQAACNLLSPEYDENRPRLLKATVDYDKLKLSNNDRKDANAQ
jgi:heptose-I-phosphate ethanolaminephosphotransferase